MSHASRNTFSRFAAAGGAPDGELRKKGFIRQEMCDIGDFLGNRFGRYYA